MLIETALEPRVPIHFRSLLLLFLVGFAVAVIAAMLCGSVWHTSQAMTSLIAGTCNSVTSILGYRWLARDRGWIDLKTRFKAVPHHVLVASALLPLILAAALFALVKVLGWLGVSLPEIERDSFLSGGAATLPMLFLLIVVLGPLAEEILCRGLLLDWLRQRVALWPAILLSALIFGLLHGIVLGAGLSGWLQFGYRVGLGIATASLAARYGSLRPSFVLHAANNFVVFLAVAMSADA